MRLIATFTTAPVWTFVIRRTGQDNVAGRIPVFVSGILSSRPKEKKPGSRQGHMKKPAGRRANSLISLSKSGCGDRI